MKWAVQGQQARRIGWTVGGKEREPLHSTVCQNAAQVNAAGRWLCWDGGGTGIVTKASPETSPRSGNGFPQAVPVVLFFSKVSGDRLLALPVRPPALVPCAGGQRRCRWIAQAKTPGDSTTARCTALALTIFE